ncbi:TPA: hypothetical protein N0F65_010062 [Lagenidium giganteum]|uniref:VASt domain-containing protein n=1 Tax=Lagenidium giganteum TaxID=4803 RepID=A0AAV2ZAJ6_9STRA|nr:TPA: hypothetical protein N0F65_010062 [Lagenidium giganteum]
MSSPTVRQRTVNASLMDAPGTAIPRSSSATSVDEAEAAQMAIARDSSLGPGRYSVDLFHAFDKVCQKAKSGAQTCYVVAAMVHERANIETAYARALLKLAQNAKAEDWADQFSDCWTKVQETLENVALEHSEFASKMHSSMASGSKAFATQQELQVQRLTAEGQKVRSAQQQMMVALDRAKEKYEKKCAEATEMTANVRREENSSVASVASTDSDDRLASAGQLLSKMWDTTSSFARGFERQRSKLEVCLDELIVAEKYYLQTVDFMNAQRLIYEREIKENLHAFQLTEEQRMEYLKDLLLRQQKAYLTTLQNSQQLVERLKDSMANIDEFADIEQGFRKLSADEVDHTEQGDLSNNVFYQRMTHIESMSEKGNQILRVITSTITDFITIEDHFAASLQKMLRIMDPTTASTGPDLFGTAPNLPMVADEGETMTFGWKSSKTQVQRAIDVHQEFRSLLSEPVALSLSMMKQEYESARMSAHENFVKAHTTLCHESAINMKLKQKLEAKTREFTQIFATLPDSTPANLPTSGAEETLTLMLQIAQCNASTDREKRSEAKLRQIAEEIRELQHRVDDNSLALKEKYQMYIQDIEVFISVYMKNEKYRLQVEKSSLVSFMKAFEHLLDNSLQVAQRTLTALEAIDTTKDVVDFITMNRKPWQKSKRIVPVHHNNAVLKEALRDYYRTRVGSPVASAEERRLRSSNSGDASYGSSLDNGTADDEDDPSNPEDGDPRKVSHHDDVPAKVADASEVEMHSGAIDDAKDVQPLGMSDFQKKFKLDNPEQVVESYSCALYVSNLPYHGRLYLTKDHICFNGWRDTVYVASFLDITMIEKKNTALIVPNAIEITAHGEKAFFASFVFRDECFNCIHQLQAIKKGTMEIMSNREKKTIDTKAESEVVDDSPSPLGSSAPVAPTTSPAEKQSPPEPVKRVPVIPDKDPLLDEFEIVFEEETNFSVDFAHAVLWIDSPTFYVKLLEATGETNVSVGKWDADPVTYTALTKPDSFQGSRRVSYTHNKKYMVGPSSIPTAQVQRYKWEPDSRLVVSVTSTVSDVPYCDYFRAESRWVFSATGKENVCLAQVGVRLNWIKSTWLKKQIEGTTISEARESTKIWIQAALAATKASKSSPSVSPAPTSTATSEASESPTKNVVVTTSDAPTAVPVAMASADIPTVTTLAKPAPSVAASPNAFNSILRVTNVLCILIFLYMMHRLTTVMDQMQVVTKEVMAQNREQQALLQELLKRTAHKP